jgi:hypothetical protein
VLRWLLAAYGAIAVLLVAGAQLQGIADVTGWVAVPTFGGLALALCGVLWVLATGAHALSVGRISITELTAATGTAATAPTGTRRQRRDRADVQTVRVILDAHLTVAGPGFHDVATLAAAHREAWTDWSELRNLEVFLGNQQTLSATRAIVGPAGYEPLRSTELFWFARPPGDAENPREVALRAWLAAAVEAVTTQDRGAGPHEEHAVRLLAQTQTARVNAHHRIGEIGGHVDRTMDIASDELVRVNYVRAIDHLRIASLLAAVGIAAFTWGAHHG